MQLTLMATFAAYGRGLIQEQVQAGVDVEQITWNALGGKVSSELDGDEQLC